MDFVIHPAADLFPSMSEDEFQGLKSDIRQYGQAEPIVVWQDQLIDGRHRLRACNELGRSPQVTFLRAEADPWQFVISRNLHRRHLDSSQRAMVASKLAALKRGGDRTQDLGMSIGEAAEALNVSARSVTNARIVQSMGDSDVVEAVERGVLAVSTAADFVHAIPDHDEQVEIVKQGPSAVRAVVAEKKKGGAKECSSASGGSARGQRGSIAREFIADCGSSNSRPTRSVCRMADDLEGDGRIRAMEALGSVARMVERARKRER